MHAQQVFPDVELFGIACDTSEQDGIRLAVSNRENFVQVLHLRPQQQVFDVLFNVNVPVKWPKSIFFLPNSRRKDIIAFPVKGGSMYVN